MRLPKLLTAVALSVAGALTLTAAPALAHTNPSGPASMPGMPGMDNSAVPPADTPAPDPAAAIKRARQKAQYFESDLRGANEVPGTAGPVGDPDGKATGLIRLQGDRITYAFSWSGITAPTLGHIHQGRKGVNGAVVVPLFTSAMPDTITSAAGITTITDAKVADEIRSDPGDFYLNLHTKQFPAGAVRGQLHRLNASRDVLFLLRGGTLKALLSGGQEVPVKGGPKVGDPNGFAVGFIHPRGNTRIDFAFAWSGISTPTLGHIHRGKKGVNGDVVVPLFTTALPSGVVAVAGSVKDADPAVLEQIKKNPAQFYANLHTAEFPGGAVRGQLLNRI